MKEKQPVTRVSFDPDEPFSARPVVGSLVNPDQPTGHHRPGEQAGMPFWLFGSGSWQEGEKKHDEFFEEMAKEATKLRKAGCSPYPPSTSHSRGRSHPSKDHPGTDGYEILHDGGDSSSGKG